MAQDRHVTLVEPKELKELSEENGKLQGNMVAFEVGTYLI